MNLPSRRNAPPPRQPFTLSRSAPSKAGVEGKKSRGHALLALPVLVLDARLVDLDPLDGDNALLGGEDFVEHALLLLVLPSLAFDIDVVVLEVRTLLALVSLRWKTYTKRLWAGRRGYSPTLMGP